VGAKWFRMDRQTCWSFAFRDFANTPKKGDSKHACVCLAFPYVWVHHIVISCCKTYSLSYKNLKFRIVVMCVTVYLQIFCLWYIVMFILSLSLAPYSCYFAGSSNSLVIAVYTEDAQAARLLFYSPQMKIFHQHWMYIFRGFLTICNLYA